jgi:hypothetical protein
MSLHLFIIFKIGKTLDLPDKILKTGVDALTNPGMSWMMTTSLVSPFVWYKRGAGGSV